MVDKDLVASDLSELCIAFLVQARNVHISEQLKITLKVTLHGMIFKQQVPVLAGFLSLQATPSHADRTMMPFLLHTGSS